MPETAHPETVMRIATGSGRPFAPEAAVKVLDSFLGGDEMEQRETLECLKRGLDERRLPDSKLFP